MLQADILSRQFQFLQSFHLFGQQESVMRLSHFDTVIAKGRISERNVPVTDGLIHQDAQVFQVFGNGVDRLQPVAQVLLEIGQPLIAQVLKSTLGAEALQ